VKREGGRDADEGTAAHKLLELALLKGKSPEAWRGKTVEGFEVTTDMINAVEVACDYVRQIEKANPGSTRHVEVLVPISCLDYKDDSGQGHVDVTIETKAKELYVIDYKHGRGVPVEAVGNSQMRLYSLGYSEKEKTKFKRYHNVIIQPRCPHGDGPIRVDSYDWKELRAFEASVLAVRKQIISGDAPLVPGEKQCRWCAHKGNCPAIAKRAAEIAKQDFADFIDIEKPAPKEKPATSRWSADELAALMHQVDFLKGFIGAIEGEVFDRLRADDPKIKKHFKLVAGKSNRKWVDPEEAMREFARRMYDIDEYAPRSLVGIGEAEKILTKEEREEVMRKLTTRPTPKPTVALASDPRPAYNFTNASDDFADHITKED